MAIKDAAEKLLSPRHAQNRLYCGLLHNLVMHSARVNVCVHPRGMMRRCTDASSSTGREYTKHQVKDVSLKTSGHGCQEKTLIIKTELPQDTTASVVVLQRSFAGKEVGSENSKL